MNCGVGDSRWAQGHFVVGLGDPKSLYLLFNLWNLSRERLVHFVV